MTGTQNIGRQTQTMKRHTRIHLLRRLRRCFELLEALPLFFFVGNGWPGRRCRRRPATNTETECKGECLKTPGLTILNCILNFAHSPNMTYTERKVLDIPISTLHSAWPATRGTQQRSEHVAFHAAARPNPNIGRLSKSVYS